MRNEGGGFAANDMGDARRSWNESHVRKSVFSYRIPFPLERGQGG